MGPRRAPVMHEMSGHRPVLGGLGAGPVHQAVVEGPAGVEQHNHLPNQHQ